MAVAQSQTDMQKIQIMPIFWWMVDHVDSYQGY